MSNIVHVNCIESKLITDTKSEFGIIVRDNYATATDIGYESVTEFLEQYPTPQSIVDWIGQQVGFQDSDYILFDKLVSELDGSFPVIIQGYPG